MASALLTIPFPNEYGVIDIRAWQSLYELGMVDYQKEVFNLKDWLLYLKIIREASKEWEISPREVDKVLFMYDKVNRKGVLYKN